MREYGQHVETHERPYVYTVETGNGALFVYGSEHTKDPHNPQLPHIKEKWDAFKPTVALVEGRLGFLFPPFMDPVKNYGEMGWVKSLAARDKVKLYSWEPHHDSINARLMKRFAPEQLALYRILSPYFSNLRFGKPSSPEKYVEDVLDRAAEFGVQDKFRSANDVDLYWKEYFPNGPDWREVSDQWGVPGYLAEVGDERNWVRNCHLHCILMELVRMGERVFIIGGSSHAVCVEPAIKSTTPSSADAH